ncbi:hypothetical protein Z949_1940 [Sulfitobacter guttiformis KCTC 32187]|nr:hypothetical protein Z949_1940 [Sulfitobacter guttiformis KCTC 32187]
MSIAKLDAEVRSGKRCSEMGYQVTKAVLPKRIGKFLSDIDEG